ncbi:MAG TPA: hydroxyethylthiazole kinase [Beijerinckiaceae bacterium]
MKLDPRHVAEIAGRLRAEVAAARPLVQNITNYVSMDIAANALLAVGASPAMIQAPEEIPQFTPMADALVINVGTLSAEGAAAMELAATTAHMHGKPWLLDPVAAGLLTFRDDIVQRLLRHRPAVIRGNASEIMAVARGAGLTRSQAAPRGVDAAHSAQDAAPLAEKLARHCSCAVVATGDVDVVTDGETTLRVSNGSPLMPRVTALGCSMSAVMAAYLAIAPTSFDAAIGATALYGVAGDHAAARASGPASFRTAFLDALYALTPDDIASGLKASS